MVALNPLSSASLLGSLGTLGLFIVLFAETGLLIGFVLPGDSLLFTAGVLCSTSPGQTGHLSLPLAPTAALAAGMSRFVRMPSSHPAPAGRALPASEAAAELRDAGGF